MVRLHKDKASFVPSQHAGFHTFAMRSNESPQTRTAMPDDGLSLMTDCVCAHSDEANALNSVAGVSIVTTHHKLRICFHSENEFDDCLLNYLACFKGYYICSKRKEKQEAISRGVAISFTIVLM